MYYDYLSDCAASTTALDLVSEISHSFPCCVGFRAIIMDGSYNELIFLQVDTPLRLLPSSTSLSRLTTVSLSAGSQLSLCQRAHSRLSVTVVTAVSLSAGSQFSLSLSLSRCTFLPEPENDD